MLSKKHRLSKSVDVKKTTAKGRSFFNPFFVIKSLPSDSVKATVIVSNKVSKSAVARNKIKRMVREELKKALPRIKPGNYAIIIKPAAAKISMDELKTEMTSSLQKLLHRP